MKNQSIPVLVVAVLLLGPVSSAFATTANFQGLGDLSGGDFYSYAYDVSADGSTVVGRGSRSYLGEEAFRWTDLNGNGLVDPDEKLDNHPEFGLGDLSGGYFSSVAFGVSADGSTVVGGSRSASGDEAFRWTSASGMVGLGDLAGGSFSSAAYGVSADGATVVGYSDSASGGEAFRWTSASGMVGLGVLDGDSFGSYAYDVSADGAIVVGYSISASGWEAFWEAFIWDTVNGMQNLRDVLVSDYGLDLTGWRLERATGISDDGLTIVGYGYNPDLRTEAWVATIPEPATFLLFGLGSLILRRLKFKN